MYLEHKKLYRKPDLKMDVPVGLYEVEIGKGKIVREGSDVTIVTWSGMVSVAQEAAEKLEKENISVEIVDIRTIVPLDEEIILNSVEKTSNICILQEDVPFHQLLQKFHHLLLKKVFGILITLLKKLHHQIPIFLCPCFRGCIYSKR